MVGCLAISDFPAWARQAEPPRRRLLAVFSKKTIVARTRALARKGLRNGDSLERAQSLFPDAHFVEQDKPFERAAWAAVIQHINGVTPFVQAHQEGLAFFKPYDFSECCSLAEFLSARVGIGPNRSIAHIAACRTAAGSVLQIKSPAVGRFLQSTRLNVLAGMGYDESIVERLGQFGLSSLFSVASLTQKQLNAQFGQAGLSLYDLLHPARESSIVPLYSPPPLIIESYSLEGAPAEWLPLNHLVNELVRRATIRLGAQLCRVVTLELICSREEAISRRRVLKKPTSNRQKISFAAAHLLEQALSSDQSIDRLSLSLGGLQNPLLRQASLFSDRPSAADAVKSIDTRFPGAIRRALVSNPDAPFPEDAFQLVPYSVSNTG